ncbi:MAG TPA: fibrobacter succinogenes major paralogous domain-containing protein, partial [Polyangia bacterium]|nr:fibrobacter succinogenes major paralogous domain-containing protein [Polyangia bacterium]
MLRPVTVGLLAVVLGSACDIKFPPLPQAPPPLGSATDIDGNSYATVVIGKQEWMASNLKATRYNDGTPIPITEDAFTWANLSTGSYSWYDDDITNKDVYGALYNWYVIQYLELRSRIDDICPTNFYLPSRGVWEALVDELGGSMVASGALKEAGTSHWDPPNTGATNQSGFTALPAGNRDDTGSFVAKGQSSS